MQHQSSAAACAKLRGMQPSMLGPHAQPCWQLALLLQQQGTDLPTAVVVVLPGAAGPASITQRQ
jgi:hypothetical protein